MVLGLVIFCFGLAVYVFAACEIRLLRNRNNLTEIQFDESRQQQVKRISKLITEYEQTPKLTVAEHEQMQK